MKRVLSALSDLVHKMKPRMYICKDAIVIKWLEHEFIIAKEWRI